MDLPLMIAKHVTPSSVMVVTRNAPGGTSPWSVPPVATFPVGFQVIGQNGLRVPGSTWNEDLFLSVMGGGSSVDLFLSSIGAGSSFDLFFSAIGAGFSSAASKAGAARIDIQMREKNLFIVFQ
jgi:hypothetical protein